MAENQTFSNEITTAAHTSTESLPAVTSTSKYFITPNPDPSLVMCTALVLREDLQASLLKIQLIKFLEYSIHASSYKIYS